VTIEAPALRFSHRGSNGGGPRCCVRLGRLALVPFLFRPEGGVAPVVSKGSDLLFVAPAREEAQGLRVLTRKSRASSDCHKLSDL
jgi:hypothetical protein